MQRRPLGPVTPGRVDTHDDGILLADLIDAVAEAEEEDLINALAGVEEDDLINAFAFAEGHDEDLQELLQSLTPADLEEPAPAPRTERKRKRSNILHMR